MKIKTITFNHTRNYGASLQMYALKEYLQYKQNEVQVVDYRPPVMKQYLKPKIYSLKDILFYLLGTKRRHKFNKFYNDFIEFTSLCCSVEDIQNLDEPDIFIAGSDQIWNTDITGGIDRGYFINFPTNAKKIFYAASMGKDLIDKEEIKKVVELVKGCDAISVREEGLAKALLENGIKSVSHVLDPVFLLDSSDYYNIMIKPKFDNYVLIYQMAYDNESYRIATKIAKQFNLKVVELGRYRRYKGVDYIIQGVGPLEFLGLISNASYVVTNSFHGTAFSIIFEKQFYTVKLRQRNSRIESLLKSLGLLNRQIDSTANDSLHRIDYDKVKILLEDEINKSKDFLKQAIVSSKGDC